MSSCQTPMLGSLQTLKFCKTAARMTPKIRVRLAATFICSENDGAPSLLRAKRQSSRHHPIPDRVYGRTGLLGRPQQQFNP